MSTAPIERTVQSKATSNLRTLQLVFPEPGVATFVRPRAMKVGLALIVVTVVALTVGGPLFLMQFFRGFTVGGHEIFVPLMIFFLSIDLIVGAIITLLFTAFWRVRPLIFNKKQGRLWRRGQTDPIMGDYALLKDVEAVQVCSTMVAGIQTDTGPAEPYKVYELNVVLQRPAGARVPALCHGNRGTVFADARTLAEFLGVPLLDHSEVVNKTVK